MGRAWVPLGGGSWSWSVRSVVLCRGSLSLPSLLLVSYQHGLRDITLYFTLQFSMAFFSNVPALVTGELFYLVLLSL